MNERERDTRGFLVGQQNASMGQQEASQQNSGHRLGVHVNHARGLTQTTTDPVQAVPSALTPKAPRASVTGLDRHCGACGEGGHNQRNRKCPKKHAVTSVMPAPALALKNTPTPMASSLTTPWLPLATGFTVGLSAAALVLAIVVRMGWVLS